MGKRKPTTNPSRLRKPVSSKEKLSFLFSNQKNTRHADPPKQQHPPTLPFEDRSLPEAFGVLAAQKKGGQKGGNQNGHFERAALLPCR